MKTLWSGFCILDSREVLPVSQRVSTWLSLYERNVGVKHQIVEFQIAARSQMEFSPPTHDLKPCQCNPVTPIFLVELLSLLCLNVFILTEVNGSQHVHTS